MSSSNKIVWHEGMFLQPQHFQQHDRYIENLVNHKVEAIDKNHWGFSELSVDHELFAIGKINIISAKGIFPDGTPFNIPHTDKLPKSFVIPEGLSNEALYLALPLRQHSVEIGTETSEQSHRYNVLESTVSDSTIEVEQTTNVKVGSLACKILTEHDDLSGYTCIAFAKIKESRSNDQITMDKTFLTTWLDIHSTNSLSDYIKEVHQLLNHRAEMLAGRLTDTQQAGTAEIVDFMLLQLVNRYEPLFHYLIRKRPLHPEQLYTILIQLMGEMATYTNNQRRPIEPPSYQHNNLFATFQPIIKAVRQALSMVLEQNATSIKLEDRSHGLWVGQVHDKTLFNTSDFVLAVYADAPTETIRTLFPNQLKIAPVEQIRTLVSRALPGVPINAIAVAPRQIPYHSNFSYFTINTQHEIWKLMEKSGGIALHIGTKIPGLKLELWAIKG